MMGKLIVFLIVVSFLVAITNCGGTVPGPGELAVTTPDTYSENRILFLNETSMPSQRWMLNHAYEMQIDSTNSIERLAPLGCIIRGVRLPEDMKGKKDIAVVLNVITDGEDKDTPLVAFYQRNVPGGQMLNFQDLFVFYDPEWNGVTPPRFRVRVLEVTTERDGRITTLLEGASKLSGSLAGMVPHPVLPSVKTAIEAAKIILTNKRNSVIIDYQVSFYSQEQEIGAGSVKLTPLRKGDWIVVGRPKDSTSSFWKQDLELDRRTKLLLNKNNEPIMAPYILLNLMSADAEIPKHVLDRSQALLKLLDSPTERTNFDGLNESVRSLNSTLIAYQLERRLKKHKSSVDFIELINTIKRFNATEEGKKNLRTEQIRTLVRLASEMAEVLLDNPQKVEEWWDKPGVAEGYFIRDKNAKYGVRWQPKEVNNDAQE